MLTIRHFEELSLNALPSLETIYYDGWVLRFAGGYPRRANSIQLLYPSRLPLDEKIAYCEAQYDARGLNTVFKLTDHAPREVEAPLEARGYIRESQTIIQTLDLAGIDAPLAAPFEVVIEPHLSDAWMADCTRLNGLSDTRSATMAAIFARIPVTAAFVRLRRDGETVALALGVVDQGWIGLFDVVTTANARQQGVGTALVQQMLAWGKQHGAFGAYLQVFSTNTPALKLYAKLGFAETYRYWYLQNRM